MLSIQPPEPSVTLAWLAFLTPVALGGNAWLNKHIADKQEAQRKAIAEEQKLATTRVAELTAETASKAQESASEAQKQTMVVVKTTAEIHTLVNSQYGIVLADNLATKMRIAAITDDPADHEAVEVARLKLFNHEKKQHAVDTRAETK